MGVLGLGYWDNRPWLVCPLVGMEGPSCSAMLPVSGEHRCLHRASWLSGAAKLSLNGVESHTT